MKKNSFEGFIARYNLGGEVESVKINSTDSGMEVSFISDDKTLLGSVTSEETEFPTLIGDLKKTLIENVAVTEMKLGDLTNLSNFSDGWTNKISELYDMFND